MHVRNPPRISFTFGEIADALALEELSEGRGLVNGRYVHWDTLAHLAPPGDISQEVWWGALKFVRSSGQRRVHLLGPGGDAFTFNLTDSIAEGLHKIDQMAGGNIQVSERITNPSTRDRYVVSSLIEEAITSSQLEGASTTRRVAKEMLRSGRPPRDRSEQMIANNFQAMQRVRQLAGEPLTRELVLELHRIVTRESLDDPIDAGRFQAPGDERVGVYSAQNELLYAPPPADEIPALVDALCDFANGKEKKGAFIHPAVRAILIHFAIGYIHPFVDGNGRTARALFYWSMLSQGYWLAEFLTISAILRKAPSKYVRAYLYTETDDLDLTYFIDYHLDVVNRSIKELHAYLDRKAEEIKEAERLARSRRRFNHRQLALLGHAVRNADATYTIHSHQVSHGVVYQTARTDLFGLVNEGLLTVRRVGRADHFTPPVDLVDLLRRE
jgi:Fic family protein